MRINAVRGFDPLREERSFQVGRCHEVDLAEAVALEHACENSTCQVCHALDAGFAAVAADLLSHAMDVYLLVAVDAAHGFNRTALPISHLETEWLRWLAYWGEAEGEGRIWQCLACEASNFDSGECGSCRARRPVWRLSIAAYCGMASELASDTDPGPVRARAARAIRRARRRGYDVAVRERGAVWEILEPERSVLVPGECGVLSLELAA